MGCTVDFLADESWGDRRTQGVFCIRQSGRRSTKGSIQLFSLASNLIADDEEEKKELNGKEQSFNPSNSVAKLEITKRSTESIAFVQLDVADEAQAKAAIDEAT